MVTFGGLDEPFSRFDSARILIWPIPYEATTTYGRGTIDGPRAILEASCHMELYDEEIGGEVYRLGIHTLPPTQLTGPPEQAMHQLYARARELLEERKFICALGGEHAITPPIVRATAEVYPRLSVLQIDAHCDLRPQYDGTPYSHACVAARLVDICPVVQVGVRSLSVEEARALADLPVKVFYAHHIVGRTDWIDAAIESLSENVYLTIDVDGLDPSLIPATGTPEPGGLSWYETLTLLRRLAERRHVVGMDVSELSPIPHLHAPDFAVAKLIYKTLGYVFRRTLLDGIE